MNTVSTTPTHDRDGSDVGGDTPVAPASTPVPTRRSLSGREPRRRPRANGSRATRLIKEVLLLIAGIGGILSILWLVASLVFGLSIVIFMTGSMSPTLPTGAAAIVKDAVPAAELQVGDVVTVPREGQPLPVTHRIVDIAPVDPLSGAGPEARELTLRGDDNDTNDRETYVVAAADRVIVGAPFIGHALTIMQTPIFFGALTLGVMLLVIWAFWPVRTS
ncbi:signal peptidase I [Okibacterium fritillariae]|uniref:Signal peptidase I n=1 Tax=Okibacterium fritillariae TaxID=123320 RepID=A0A1T5I9E1_9MICO|nr:signal peptidase I [Okibacterium fritillariae]SKC35786.1 signal peptidase, endoplasmic reticulum-type [Okibacterium fritillariae]